MNQIERLSRIRRRILWIVLAGTGLATALLLGPFVLPATRTRWFDIDRTPFPAFYWAFVIWGLTIALFAASFILYKKKLRKDPGLGAAVDDERVKASWMRAYRTAFLAVMAMAVLSKLFDIFFAFRVVKTFMLPGGLWLVLTGGVLSLVGSFLHFSRETAGD